METLDLLRWLLARDAASRPATDRWDAATWETVHRAVIAWDAAPLAFAAMRAARANAPPAILAPARTDTAPARTDTAPARTDTAPGCAGAPADRAGAPADRAGAPARTDTAAGCAGAPADRGSTPADRGGAPVRTDTAAERAGAPAAIVAEWRRDHTATTAVNLRLAFEAEALVGALAASGAGAISLKGTALFLLGVWRDPGARPTCDVDLLIRPEDAAIVHRVMLGRGYAQARAGGSKHWPPYAREGLVVEVHEHAFWSLADGHRVRLAEMIDANGRPTLAMTVAHLVHHLFESSVTTPWLAVKTLADLAEVRAFVEARAASESGLADEIASAVRRVGLGRRLGALAGLLALVLDRPVPAAWTRERRASDVEALLARCVPDSGSRVQARRLVDRTAAFTRMPLQEKTTLLRHYLLPPAEAMRAAYGLAPGSPWVWPLYPLRPVHLLARSALDAARLLMPKRGAGSSRSQRH